MLTYKPTLDSSSSFGPFGSSWKRVAVQFDLTTHHTDFAIAYVDHPRTESVGFRIAKQLFGEQIFPAAQRRCSFKEGEQSGETDRRETGISWSVQSKLITGNW